MTADVWILVENYKVVRALVNDQAGGIVAWFLLRFTEYTGALRVVGAGVRDIFVSPGTPQSFHNATYLTDMDQRGSRRILVDQFLQLFSGFEVGHALGGNVDRLTGLRISAAPGTAFTNAKTTKAAQLNFLTVIETVDNTLKNDLNESFSIFLGQFGGIGYVVDQIRFSHASTSLRKSAQ